ncbi:hypothetical protein [Tepidibacillus decaturensis]|uniref:Uncharacterized protein n=1 Tax=Tepidibacillus decaturensis TaxID=1413211 RepID=A0A135L6A3_9BACI|nr:hypothetical protein [Tepidibacillus decaturensis]KXG44496.1 hypothetical protein U473_11080 [Tepidibacillus decaturensis]
MHDPKILPMVTDYTQEPGEGQSKENNGKGNGNRNSSSKGNGKGNSNSKGNGSSNRPIHECADTYPGTLAGKAHHELRGNPYIPLV